MPQESQVRLQALNNLSREEFENLGKSTTPEYQSNNSTLMTSLENMTYNQINVNDHGTATNMAEDFLKTPDNENSKETPSTNRRRRRR